MKAETLLFTDPVVRRWVIFLTVSLVLLAGLVGFTGAVVERRTVRELERQAQSSAALHAAVLRSELAKHRSLPFVLAQDPDVASTLRSADPRGVDALNRKLETLSAGTRAAVIYVLNARGMTIAASNWRQPTSFVGSDYSFRPYFKDARDQGVAELFALGTVSRRPGLFMARRIEGPDGLLGVVVVKVEFRDLTTNKVLYENPAQTFKEEYEVTSVQAASDAAAFFGQNVNAMERIANDFAKTVVTSILEAF